MSTPLDVLWEANKDRRWIRFLYEEYKAGSKGKDFDTIAFWVSKIRSGERVQVILDSRDIVQDGNHRLVAAKVAGAKSIDVSRN